MTCQRLAFTFIDYCTYTSESSESFSTWSRHAPFFPLNSAFISSMAFLVSPLAGFFFLFTCCYN